MAEAVIVTDLVTVARFADTIAHPVMVGVNVNGNEAFGEPAGIVTEAGIVKPALVDRRVTVDGAPLTAVRLTVHVPPWPGATRIGEQVKEESEYGDGESATGKDTDVGPT